MSNLARVPAARQIVLLRGVNLGPRNRVAMPELREQLRAAGFEHVSTYVQSGNVVLSSNASPAQLADQVGCLLAERFELDVQVIVRTRDELAQVVARDPLSEVALDPKRYQVSFLERGLDEHVLSALSALATGEERFVAVGRELYAWHPHGVARSKLWARLADRNLGGWQRRRATGPRCAPCSRWPTSRPARVSDAARRAEAGPAGRPTATRPRAIPARPPQPARPASACARESETSARPA